MRIAKSEYDFPDDCRGCRRESVSMRYGQNDLCGRCPVFCCPMNEIETGDTFRLIEPEEYRPDWIDPWIRFFEDGVEPALPLFRQEDR